MCEAEALASRLHEEDTQAPAAAMADRAELVAMKLEAAAKAKRDAEKEMQGLRDVLRSQDSTAAEMEAASLKALATAAKLKAPNTAAPVAGMDITR